MLHVTWKGLLAHKIRLATTAIAVLIGVAFMAGTLVLTATISKTFDGLFTDSYAGTGGPAAARACACLRKANPNRA